MTKIETEAPTFPSVLQPSTDAFPSLPLALGQKETNPPTPRRSSSSPTERAFARASEAGARSALPCRSADAPRQGSKKTPSLGRQETDEDSFVAFPFALARK